ncbi:MAG TPA: TIGR03619 family F420-dependent LLM class oxidoreductase [Conexibacter sp.]
MPQQAGYDLRRDVAEVARTAEQLGYTSLWTFERLLLPDAPKDAYFGEPSWPEGYRQTADALAVLTVAAMATSSARLGTSALVAATHAPVHLAKSFATIDQISGGRMLAGITAGWSSDELQTLGVTRADRGRLLDETIDVFNAVWGPDPVEYRGPRAVIDPATIRPKPAARIPILLGGTAGSTRTLQRIATRADGWLPVIGAGQFQETSRTWDQIRDTAAAHGRDASQMELIVVGNVTFADGQSGDDRVPFIGTIDQVVDDIDAAAAAGADEVIIDLTLQRWATTAVQVLEAAQQIQERVREARI